MLELKALSKKFGSVTAVDDLSFSVGAGEIFGLLGANGAGKTTTLRMLATMLSPTAGTAVLGGYDLLESPHEVRGRMGLMFGGESGLYDRLSARENILYFAALNGVDEDVARRRADELIETFHFSEYAGKWAGKLSKGTRQKVTFARAIIHDPAVMLFDEPFLGLDVTSRKEAENFILKCRAAKKTIVLSDHTLSVIEKLCDRVGILSKGKLLGAGTIAELCAKNDCATLEDVFFRLAGERHEH